MNDSLKNGVTAAHSRLAVKHPCLRESVVIFDPAKGEMHIGCGNKEDMLKIRALAEGFALGHPDSNSLIHTVPTADPFLHVIRFKLSKGSTVPDVEFRPNGNIFIEGPVCDAMPFIEAGLQQMRAKSALGQGV